MTRPRVSFEIVALEDAKIFSAILNTSDIAGVMRRYYSLLDVCGWSREDYEKELLTRVDKEWTSLHKRIVLGKSCHSN